MTLRTMGTEIRTWLPKPLVMGATAYLVGSNLPALVRFFAQIARQIGFNVWVCDGVGDEVEIAAAIAAVNALGGGTVVAFGRLNLDGAFPNNVNFNNTNNIVFRGTGRGTQLFVRNNGASEVFRAQNCAHIIVEDLSIDMDVGVVAVNGLTVCPDVGETAEDITYRRIWVNHAMTSIIIQQEGTSRNIRFQQINATNSYRQGLWFWAEAAGVQDPDGAQDITVEDCEIDTVINDGAANINGYGAFIQAGKNTKIVRCIIRNAQKSGIRAAGLNAANLLEDIDIEGCSISDNGQGGLATYNDGIQLNGAVRGFSIVNNRIFDSRVGVAKTQRYGVFLGTLAANVSTGKVCLNRIWGNVGDGVRSETSYVEIAENDCFSNGGAGIRSIGYYVSIVGNNCNNNTGNGIYCTSGGFASIVGNACIANTACGIQTVSAEFCTIADNTVRQAGTDGINVLNSTQVLVRGNVIYESNQSNTNRDNIWIEGCDDILVEANLCRQGTLANKPRYGVRIQAGVTDTTLRDNDLRDSGSVAPILNSGTNTDMYRRHSDIFMDVLAVSANHVVIAQTLAADPTVCAIAAQPDVPRTLSYAITHPTLTAFTLTFVGVNAKGETVTEVFTQATGWTGETSNAFARVTSITMSAMTGNTVADIIDVGITDVLGFSNNIYETGDVYKIKKNNANAVVAAAQVNITYDTYDMAVIGLAVGDDFTIWFRSNLNVVG